MAWKQQKGTLKTEWLAFPGPHARFSCYVSLCNVSRQQNVSGRKIENHSPRDHSSNNGNNTLYQTRAHMSSSVVAGMTLGKPVNSSESQCLINTTVQVRCLPHFVVIA